MRFTNIALASIAANMVAGHPGHDVRKEMAERRQFLKNSRRDLSHCAEKMRARGLERRAVHRRNNLFNTMVKERGLKARDLDSVLATSHLSSEDYTLNTDESVLFASNGSCVLSPEVTQGPYYVSGEYVRENIAEDQEGVPLYVDAQVLDMDTCEPVTGVYVEIWHCNSTGVYSGVVASGNGVGTEDPSNLDNTFLRGLQLTDDEGVVGFESIFPGHYTGRTTHIHAMVHADATELANGTIMDTTAAHVGQMFFDQDLITQVEAVEPYASNTQDLTTNEDDSILSEEAASSDPVMEYVLLGDSVEDGILAWLSFGIDTSSSYSVNAAATLYESGGVSNSGSSDSSSGSGGAQPSGTSGPGGAQPSGASGPGGAQSGGSGGFPGRK